MPAAPRKASATTARPAARRMPKAGPAARVKVAVPDGPDDGDAAPPSRPDRVEEPVWLVRAVILLFLVGFAAFLAREVRNFASVLP